MPTTEKKPVTTAIADNGMVSGDLEVDAKSLGQRSRDGGGHHRCERGDGAGDGEPAERRA